MRLLDLFCGAGGAGAGYHLAGFDVTGVDLAPMPRYPYQFIQGDALAALADAGFVAGFDVIHASPPCQHYSVASNCRPGLAARYPDLIAPVRAALDKTGLPYVIENVPGAPLIAPVVLCGAQFGLSAEFNGRTYELHRHRLFEANWGLTAPAGCVHSHRAWPVFGHGKPGNRPDLAGPGYAATTRQVMGIGWMRREEIAESIPPAFTQWVGKQLAALCGQQAKKEAA